jgi:PDDEXK-like domain of unknown function (DUF3799)
MILSPEELPISQYHGPIDLREPWLSKTPIKDFRTMGPKRWAMTYLDRTLPRPEKTAAMEEGSMIDCLLTEGSAAFHARYAVAPIGAPKRPTSAQLNAKKPSPETLDAIAYWAPFAGKIIVSQDDYSILLDAVEAITALPMWPRIRQSMVQRSIRRFSPALGLGLQSRPDWLEIDGSRAITFDLKKVAQFDRFGDQAIDLDYHTQAGIAGWCLASDELEHAEAFLVAVEWERGARAKVYQIPTEALADGFNRALAAVTEISTRLKLGDWMPAQVMSEPLPIKAWRARQMAEVA